MRTRREKNKDRQSYRKTIAKDGIVPLAKQAEDTLPGLAKHYLKISGAYCFCTYPFKRDLYAKGKF